jgi:mannose-1-phosphate guanylyltransferase
MAGGAGKRLWPMSCPEQPKQLLPIINGRSLLEIAAERLDGVVPPDRRYICTGERYRGVIRERMPAFADARILGEPEGRDTLNAVAFTAAVLRKIDPEAVFAVLTADHLIQPEDEFRRRLELGFDLVEADAHRMVTFAITPTFPATGFGYVERGAAIPGVDGAFHAARFVEKPDEATAAEFVASGRWGWNSGMFIFHAGTLMDAVRRFKPDSYEPLLAIASAYRTTSFREVLNDVYPTLAKDSVDYGVMEPASNDETLSIVTIPMAVQWRDIGSWPSFGETLDADAHGNRATGRAVHLDSRNVLAVSDDPSHTIATIGCEDLIIVRTKDATLVCRADRAQDVKALADLADAP